MNLCFALDNNDNGVVRAGEYLSGTLVINAARPVPARGLPIYFRGKEYTSVRYKDYNNDGELVNKVAHEKHQFFRVDVFVPNVSTIVRDGEAVPGYYEVPFQVALPQDLPTTMCVNENNQDKAEIAYSLRAQLTGSGTFWNYQARLPIRVLPTAKSHRVKPSPYEMKPTMSGRGEIGYGAKVPRTVLSPGQSAEAYIAFVNGRGVSQLDAVELDLMQFVEWSARGHHKRWSNTLWSDRLRKDQLLGGFQKNLDKYNKKPKPRRFKWFKKKQSGRSIEIDPRNCALCMFQVPQNGVIHEPIEGPLINVVHSLRIKLATKRVVEEMTIPIRIAKQATDKHCCKLENILGSCPWVH